MLAQKIKALITEKGPIPFSAYMELCLFDSEYGYYTKLTDIGKRGDFITAPECGPYFAKAIAGFLENKLAQLENPVILELGGGTGQFAQDLLSFLQTKVQYFILEKSPSLRKIQKDKLTGHDVTWLEEVNFANVEGVVLANEFFDALPVERFTEEGQQCFVTFQDNQLVETGTGQYFEKCLLFKEVLRPILQAFKRGFALVVDYGDERIERSTLTAYQQHQIVSVFDSPGECDITAHVDFTDLAEAFLACGWNIDFLKAQGQFLLEQDILPESGLSAENYAIKRLIDPRLMGQLFKVMGAAKI